MAFLLLLIYAQLDGKMERNENVYVLSNKYILGKEKATRQSVIQDPRYL